MSMDDPVEFEAGHIPPAPPRPEPVTEVFPPPFEEPAPEAHTEGPPEAEIAAPDPASAGPTLDEVVAQLTRIEDGVGEYERLLARQTEVTDKLHEENQVLRCGELRQAQSGLVLEVIRVIDDIGRMWLTAGEESRSDLQLIGEALADALSRNGVERAAVAVGDPFNGKSHKIAGVSPTTDPEANRTVAEVTRPGYAWADGAVIRVADVVVHRHVPAPPPESTPPPTDRRRSTDDDRRPDHEG